MRRYMNEKERCISLNDRIDCPIRIFKVDNEEEKDWQETSKHWSTKDWSQCIGEKWKGKKRETYKTYDITEKKKQTHTLIR